MDKRTNRVVLYSSQAELVVDILQRDGVCFSKKQYVVKKYEESAPIFVAAYDWFVMEAEKHLAKPKEAEYPYWAFKEVQNVDLSGNNKLLKLSVPMDQVLFFDMYDWYKILRLQYIGESEADEERFQQMVADQGINRESDIILTSFYPYLKRQVKDSWKRLFRHNESIRQGNLEGVESVQAALWQIKKEWVV